MKLLTSLLTTLSIALNTFLSNLPRQYNTPRIIDAYILAYDAIYTGDNEPAKDYIILDMESLAFVDTTYEDRQKTITYFKKYNKPVFNGSLFKLKEMGLADKTGQLQINGDLLMITNIQPDDTDGIVIEGTKWFGPVAAYLYKIRLKDINEKWKVVEIKTVGVA